MAYDFYKETQEAISAGERALSSLRNAQNELSSAKNWGLFDMLGGGFVSTLVKHGKMDNAKRYMEQAKYDLNSFSRELRDVNMSVNLNIDTHDFLTFADFFFDGLVADYLVQSKIEDARRQVSDAINMISDILRTLRDSV